MFEQKAQSENTKAEIAKRNSQLYFHVLFFGG